MATLWIREYEHRGTAGGGRDIQIAKEPGTDQTPLTYSTSAQSDAFGETTKYIAIISTTAFHYVVGANPTATTDALLVSANETRFFGVEPGQKIAAISAS